MGIENKNYVNIVDVEKGEDGISDLPDYLKDETEFPEDVFKLTKESFNKIQGAIDKFNSLRENAVMLTDVEGDEGLKKMKEASFDKFVKDKVEDLNKKIDKYLKDESYSKDEFYSYLELFNNRLSNELILTDNAGLSWIRKKLKPRQTVTKASEQRDRGLEIY